MFKTPSHVWLPMLMPRCCDSTWRLVLVCMGQRHPLVELVGREKTILTVGLSSPTLSASSNPLMQESPKRAVPSPPLPPFGLPEDDGAEDLEDEGDHRNNAIVVTPFPGRMPMGSSIPAPESNVTGVQEAWVKFFDHWINQSSSIESARRIIVLESIESMATTFDQWWPSLVEAVRRRRGEKAKGKKSTLTLAKPTTIVFASAPSLLLPHTSPSAASSKEQESAVKTLHPMLQEIADRLGGTVETKVENNDNNPLWWASEEVDKTGRRERNGRRLAALLDDAKG